MIFTLPIYLFMVIIIVLLKTLVYIFFFLQNGAFIYTFFY